MVLKKTKSKGSCSCCSVFFKYCSACIQPITKSNIRHHYIPLGGNVCYTALSLQILKPKVLQIVFPNKDPTNILLAGSVLGTTAFIYNSEHLKTLLQNQRFGYSIFAAGLFNFGSLLLWAMIKSGTSDKRFTHLKVVLALGSAWLLSKVGKSYIEHIESLVSGSDNNPAMDAGSGGDVGAETSENSK